MKTAAAATNTAPLDGVGPVPGRVPLGPEVESGGAATVVLVVVMPGDVVTVVLLVVESETTVSRRVRTRLARSPYALAEGAE